MTCLSSYSRLVGGLLLGSLLPRIELTEMTCLSSYIRLVGGLLLGSLLPRIRS